MKKVFAKQASEKTFMLVDEYGHACDEDGEIAYHPVFFSGRAEESKWPVYTETENQK